MRLDVLARQQAGEAVVELVEDRKRGGRRGREGGHPGVELAGDVEEEGDLEVCCGGLSALFAVRWVRVWRDDLRVPDSQMMLMASSRSLHSSAMDVYPTKLSSPPGPGEEARPDFLRKRRLTCSMRSETKLRSWSSFAEPGRRAWVRGCGRPAMIVDVVDVVVGAGDGSD